MNNMNNEKKIEPSEVFDRLKSNYNSVLLSTISEDGTPYTSYSPCYILGDKIYIYISSVADHYNNIIKNKSVSALIIEDEKTCATIFGRQRVTFRCEGKKLESAPQEIVEKFEAFDPKTMDVLKTLDFEFFELQILNGRLVLGFAQAYDIFYKDGKLQTEHVVIDKGHNKK